jgi:hypothetical protein
MWLDCAEYIDSYIIPLDQVDATEHADSAF